MTRLDESESKEWETFFGEYRPRCLVCGGVVGMYTNGGWATIRHKDGEKVGFIHADCFDDATKNRFVPQ